MDTQCRFRLGSPSEPILPYAQRPHPNPTHTTASITWANLHGNGKVQIAIFDVQGKLLYSETVYPQDGKLEHTIDMSSFESGVYLVTATSANGTKSVRLTKK